MERIKMETITESTTKIEVKVTVNRISKDKYYIYAMPIDKKGNNLLKNAIRRTKKSEEEAEKSLTAVARIAAKKALPRLPPTKSSKPASSSSKINETVKKLLDDGVNIYPKKSAKEGWSPRVCRATLTYFLNHDFAAFWEEHQESDDYEAELLSFRNKLIEKAAASGKSKGSKIKATGSVDAVLRRIQILCDYLSVSEGFPKFSFVKGIVLGRAIPEEQVKSIPDSIFLPFCRELERRAEEEPDMVLGTVLMADGGLRTAEAAGTPVWNVILHDSYGVVAVTYQEKDRKRIEKLKSENGYRNVILSQWGSWMVGRCIAALGWDEETENLISTGSELSAWIKQRLEEINAEFIDEASRIEATNPDCDDYGHVLFDVSAYVLRRNTASRWLNYDGLGDDEIDIMLGHKPKYKEEVLYLTDETHQRSIAEKLERYVYNKEHTGNPAFSPILLTEEVDMEIAPYHVTRLKNASDKLLDITVDAENTEPGESITSSILVGTAKELTPRSVGRGKRKGSETIIACNFNVFRKEQK